MVGLDAGPVAADHRPMTSPAICCPSCGIAAVVVCELDTWEGFLRVQALCFGCSRTFAATRWVGSRAPDTVRSDTDGPTRH